jgi:peptidoglycan/LPS O-acetylase OafA/YrhL
MLRFRRIPTQNRLIAQIDGLRFVAIAWVVFFTLTPFFRIGAPFPLPCL